MKSEFGVGYDVHFPLSNFGHKLEVWIHKKAYHVEHTYIQFVSKPFPSLGGHLPTNVCILLSHN